MALIKCKECGNDISTQAKTCPKCGAPRPKRSISLRRILIGTFLLGLTLIVIGNISSHNEVQSTAMTPAQRAAQQAEQKKHTAYEKFRDESVRRGAIMMAALKKTARNPGSFKLAEARAIEGSGAICFTYRAQNGFGGMNIGYAVLSADGKTIKIQEQDGDAFVKLWNKECTKQGYDYTDEIKQLISMVEK